MRISVFAILVCCLAMRSTRALAAAMPTAPTSLPLSSLLGSTSSLICGPFTFDDFALQVRTGGTWQTGSSDLAATLAVRPLEGGIEFAGTPSTSSLMATYDAVEIDYQVVGSPTTVGSATTTLFAWADDASASMSNELSVALPASSDAPSQADTNWSGASPAEIAAALQFKPSTRLAVTDTAAVSPGGASTLSFAVDTVFVPEPGGSAACVAGCFLCRRRRPSCEASSRVL